MKSMAELMRELGWDDKNTQGTAKAFLKHLNKAAKESNKPIAMKPRSIENLKALAPKQLSFNFDDEDLSSTKVKKSS